jgi:signal transduction histidine kinase
MRRTRLFRSLTARLILGAAVWVMVSVSGAAVALYSMFAGHIERELDSDLEEWLGVVVRAIEVDGKGALRLVRLPSDPRFDRPRSGRYWQIAEGGTPVLRSPSLEEERLRVVAPGADPVLYQTWRGPWGERLRVAQAVAAPPGLRPLHVTVTTSLAEASGDIVAFSGIMIWTLLFLGTGLVFAVYVQVRIGLQPLYRLQDQVAAVREGGAARVEGEYPTEVAPLAAELNALLESNAGVVDRARTEIGNLAHALKTPLAVLANEAARSRSAIATLVRQQAELMRRQIDHHLIRARAAGTAGLLGARVPIAPVLADLERTLAKIYAGRGISIELGAVGNAAFAGERQDLDEMLGNLIDNGCKWAANRVLVTVEEDALGCRVAVEDDGPGLPPEMTEKALERGARLDEAKPGSGLGLAIVRDIARLYGAELRLGRAAIGGLRAELALPLAAAPLPRADAEPARPAA